MKHIAVLVHTLATEYAATVVKGVYDYFADKDDVILYISQTRQPHFQEGITEYQYWASTEYLKSKSIDAIIVVSNSYGFSFDKESLKKAFHIYDDKKIISIGADLEIENSSYSICRPYAVYDELVEHLIKEHNCKKIGFMSGNLTGMPESFERLEAYKQALKNHNLEYNEDWVLHAKFTHSSALELLNKIYTSKDQIEYDAMICANDMMATAVVEKLSELGLKVPGDVAVAGFDNTTHATLCNPPLTTIDQQIYEQGKDGAELAYNAVNGSSEVREKESKLQIIYRRSCGCQEDSRQSKGLKSQFDYYTDIVRVDILIDLIRNNYTIDDFIRSFKVMEDTTGYNKMICCIMDNPVKIERNDDFHMPDKVKILFHVDTVKNIFEYYENGSEVIPSEQLFPQDLIESGNYMFQPLYLGNLQYGYLICRGSLMNFAANSISLKLLTSVIVQNYEATKALKQRRFLEATNERLLANNNDLALKTKTDELTKVLNRRGFLEHAQKLIDLSLDLGNNGLVFFADLDGLKKINDTYGHEYGDIAIQTQARVLKDIFRQSDIVGRLSGDEFSVVAPGMKLKALEGMKIKMAVANKRMSVEKKLPFDLSISFGAVEFTAENHDITELLKQADKKLYVEKRIKHGEK